MSEIIQLTDTARLVVEYDQDAANPRADWDMLTGFVKIEGRGDSRKIDVLAVHDAPIPIADAWDRLAYQVQSRYTPDEDHVIRWARIFHGLHLEYDSEHGGYWFVDPSAFQQNFPAVPGGGKVARIRPVRVDGILGANTYETYEQSSLECQAEVIKAEREAYRLWADGEVYGVVLERRASYVRVIDSDSDTLPADVDWNHTRDEWEQVDALWGCYLDDEYTAQMVADGHFTLTPEETAALNLPVIERAETPAEAITGQSGEW